VFVDPKIAHCTWRSLMQSVIRANQTGPACTTSLPCGEYTSTHWKGLTWGLSHINMKKMHFHRFTSLVSLSPENLMDFLHYPQNENAVYNEYNLVRVNVPKEKNYKKTLWETKFIYIYSLNSQERDFLKFQTLLISLSSFLFQP